MRNWEEGDIVICTEKPKQCEQLFNDLVQIIKRTVYNDLVFNLKPEK